MFEESIPQSPSELKTQKTAPQDKQEIKFNNSLNKYRAIASHAKEFPKPAQLRSAESSNNDEDRGNQLAQSPSLPFEKDKDNARFVFAEVPHKPLAVYLPSLLLTEEGELNPNLPPAFKLNESEQDRHFVITKGNRYKFFRRDIAEALLTDEARDVLTQGGEGVIVTGIDEVLGINVVAKIMRGRSIADLQDFYSTARLLANVEHPYIMKVLDLTAIYDYDGNIVPVLIMPEIKGKTANELLKTFKKINKKFSTSQVLSIITKIGDALDFLNLREKPIIHRDVKPQNIMIKTNEYGEVPQNNVNAVLIDFGASEGNIGHDARLRNSRGGSEYFLAPEMRNGRGVVGSDQYSLAISTLSLLNEHPVFHGEEPIRYFEEFELKDLKNYSKKVSQVFRKATSWKPEDRYPSSREFVDALRQALQENTEV